MTAPDDDGAGVDGQSSGESPANVHQLHDAPGPGPDEAA